MTNWSPNQSVGQIYREAMDGTLVGHMLGAVAFYLAPDDQLVLCLHHIPTSRIIRIPLGTLESPTHLVALAARFLDLPES